MLTVIGSAIALLGAVVTGGVALYLRNKAAANAPTEKENAVAARDAGTQGKVDDDSQKADPTDLEGDLQP